MGRSGDPRKRARRGQDPRAVRAQIGSAQVGRFSPDEAARHRQDFLAGTVFAAGVAVIHPDGGPRPATGPGTGPATAPPSLFAVVVNDDDTTYLPAPQLRKAFALVDRHGAMAASQKMTIATSWAFFDPGPDTGEASLVKLKLDFRAPFTGRCDIVLIAGNYAQLWHTIAGGGMIGITTQQRLDQTTGKPGAGFNDAMSACVLMGIHASPGLQMVIDRHGWPRS